MPGAIVVFSGMDGAGKSTQIELLRDRLAENHQPTITLWSRGGYTPGINALKSVLRRIRAGRSGESVIPSSGNSPERTRAFSRPLVRKAWLILAIADLMLLYGIWLRWKKFTGHFVICDRFIEDTQLDFELNFPTERTESWFLWKRLRNIAPRPDAAFLMTISVEESERRSKEKQEPFPDSRETLEMRLKKYQSWTEQPGWTVLDGTQPRDFLADQICSHLQSNAISPIDDLAFGNKVTQHNSD